MIARSTFAKGAALVVALGLHGGLMLALVGGPEAQMEGAAGGSEARLGTSFADMAAGTLEAQETAEMVSPAPVQTTEPVSPQSDVTRPKPTTAAPEAAVPIQPQEPAAHAPALPEPVAPDVPKESAAKPPAQAAPQPEAKTATGETDVPPAVTRSRRPERRSAEFEKTHKPLQPKAKAKPAPRKSAQGNARRNARKGAASGKETATSKSSGQGAKKPRAAGNAAASNYPGLVMQKISRVSRPRSSSRGTAVVSFRVAASGGLAGASIARSSGSAALDRSAVQMIRRAAPFPPPPAGAQLSFTINIKGR